MAEPVCVRPSEADWRRAAELVELLTDRQRDVLRLLALGFTTKETARALGLSASTVETHRAAILVRMHCASMVEAGAIAGRAGML